MRTTQLIKLTYANTQDASVFLNIPFEVSQIKLKQLSYKNGTKSSGSSHPSYGSITTDLLDSNQVIGLYYQDSSQGGLGEPDTTFELRNPRVLTGQYTFHLSEATFEAGTDTLLLIMEFSD